MLIYQGESALSNQFDNRLRVVPHSVPHRSICFRFLRDSRASETRAREKITSREKKRLVACRLFSRGVIFTRARVSLALLSLRKNGGLVVVCFDNLVQNDHPIRLGNQLRYPLDTVIHLFSNWGQECKSRGKKKTRILCVPFVQHKCV